MISYTVHTCYTIIHSTLSSYAVHTCDVIIIYCQSYTAHTCHTISTSMISYAAQHILVILSYMTCYHYIQYIDRVPSSDNHTLYCHTVHAWCTIMHSYYATHLCDTLMRHTYATHLCDTWYTVIQYIHGAPSCTHIWCTHSITCMYYIRWYYSMYLLYTL